MAGFGSSMDCLGACGSEMGRALSDGDGGRRSGGVCLCLFPGERLEKDRKILLLRELGKLVDTVDRSVGESSGSIRPDQLRSFGWIHNFKI